MVQEVNLNNGITQLQQKYLFIGCGNMAKALIQGLLGKQVPASQITASCLTPNKHQKFVEQTQINLKKQSPSLVETASTIILAVKPAVIPSLLTDLADRDLAGKLIISVVAGLTCQQIQQQLDPENNKPPLAIIRAMPNTPAAIGQSATGAYANPEVKADQIKQAEDLLTAVGKLSWIKQEEQINLVTAIAGSSPAYCFIFIQAMVEQAEALGMSPDTARKLATQAVLGAAQLVEARPEQRLEELVDAVTSKGGTTEAAIASLKQQNFSETIKKAVQSAYNRAQQLGDTQS